MPMMTPTIRKLALTAHIVVSVGVLGSIAAFLALAIAALVNDDVQVIRAAYPNMDLLAKFVITPLALAALISGVVQSLGTSWGLFRHYWIVAKLLVSSFATAVLLAKLELISHAANLARELDLPVAELRAAGMELAFHAASGLLVLLIPAALSVYKPKGLTVYGLWKQQTPSRKPFRQTSLAPNVSSNGVIVVTLRRNYLLGGLFAILALHILVLHLAGSGFSMH